MRDLRSSVCFQVSAQQMFRSAFTRVTLGDSNHLVMCTAPAWFYKIKLWWCSSKKQLVCFSANSLLTLFQKGDLHPLYWAASDVQRSTQKKKVRWSDAEYLGRGGGNFATEISCSLVLLLSQAVVFAVVFTEELALPLTRRNVVSVWVQLFFLLPDRKLETDLQKWQ